jgi:virginiamycin B lyase
VLVGVPLGGVAAIVTAHVAGAAVTTYTDSSISGPEGMAVGPDGALWFTNHAGNSIGRITTTGIVANYTGVGILDPYRITVGPDGALWFTNEGNSIAPPNGSIGRITTAGIVTNYTGVGISSPRGITTGPDGALWFTNAGDASIGRITTAGIVTNYTGTGISDPEGITVGADGALWFTNYTDNSIGRIATDGTVTNYTTQGGEIAAPQGITLGPDGALWFAASTSIGRFTTGGSATSYAMDPNEPSAGPITVGPDGALWYTVEFDAAGGSIRRVTTAGAVTTFTDVGISTPYGITAGPDGAVWFTNTQTNSVGRITVPVTIPDAPAIGSVASAGVGVVSVSFTPGSDGGSHITTFTATCMSLAGYGSNSASDSGSPIVVAGLVSGTPYSCSVTATNNIGTSGPSGASSVIYPASSPPGGGGGGGGGGGNCTGTPTAPRTPTAAAGNGSAIVSWAPSTSGCVAGYIVTPYLGGVAQTPTLITGHGTTTVIKGLINGDKYTFTVTAENGVVPGPASVMTASVTVGAPGAVSAVTVTKIGKGSVKVSFVAGRNNGAPIKSYTATCTSSNGGKTESKAGKASPVTVTGLTAGKTYACSVSATNSRGAGPASRQSAVVKA